VVFSELSSFAQDDSVSIGLGVPGPMPYSPVDSYYKEIQQEKLAGMRIYQVVNGKIYDSLNSRLWVVVSGEVNYTTSDGLLILYGGNGLTATMALKNYSGDAVAGKNIVALAMRAGIYNWNETPLQLWDCGIPYRPPPLTPAQIKEAKDVAKIEASRKKQKQFLSESNAVVWLQSQATNGDAGAQCGLGEHYLAGLGCETNRTKAVYWLTQAANQGDLEASNKLAEIQK